MRSNREDDEDEELLSEVVSGNITPTPLSHRVKLIKTACTCLIYLTTGLWLGVVSPSIIDLTHHFDCNYEHLSDALMTKAFGILGGSVVGAIVSDWFRPNADLYLSLAIIFGGVTYILFPVVPHLWIGAILMTINGVVHGSLNVVCSSICLAMWGEKAATPILTLHMAFTVGSTVGPIISEPFVTYQNGTQNSTYTPHSTKSLLEMSPPFLDNIRGIDFTSLSNNLTNKTSAHFEVPYYISGGLEIFTGLIFGLFFLLNLKYSPRASQPTGSTTQKSWIRRAMPSMCNQGNACYITYVLLSLFGLYVSIVMRDNSMNMYLYTIAVTSSLHIVTSQALILATVYNAMSAVGRLVAALLARCIRTDILLLTQILLALAIQILMVFYALQKPIYLWVLVCGMGLAVGPTYPTLMAWADMYVEVSGFVVAVIDLGIGIGAFLSTWLTGYLFQHYGSEPLFYVTAVGGGCVCLLFVPLSIAARVKGQRERVVQPPVYDGKEDDPLIN